MGSGASASADMLRITEACVSRLGSQDRAKLVLALAGGPTQDVSTAASASAAPAAPNSAFVFVKTSALTDGFKALVRARLGAAGIATLAEGELAGEVVDEKKLVDQHYYSIASKATILKPDQLNVPKEKFKDFFGVGWDETLASGKASNALDACAYFGMGADELDALWQRAKDGKKDWVKLGGGFQCARLEVEGKDPIYVMNGFFMSMRSKFTQPGPSIHYFVVEWDPKALSWADFRGKILGSTDPAEAAADSLRGQLFAEWEALGLKGKPWIGENGIHASASPMEALAERCNWLSSTVEGDVFGKQLLSAGVSKDMIEAWRLDPQVTIADGKTGSLFDQLEDLDFEACLRKCAELAKMQK